MSSLILPEGMTSIEDQPQPEMGTPEMASQLPKPVGYKILIALPEISETTEGGLFKAQGAMENEKIATVVGFVMKMGDLCYKDKEKFPTGAWCKEGDFIILRAFSGTRIDIHGKEFRLINDDSVEAVVKDPRGIRRA